MTKQESDDFVRDLILATITGKLDEPWTDYDDPTTTEDDQDLILRCVHHGRVVYVDRRFYQAASGIYFYHIMHYGEKDDPARVSWNYQPNDPLTDELWDTIREHGGIR